MPHNAPRHAPCTMTHIKGTCQNLYITWAPVYLQVARDEVRAFMQQRQRQQAAKAPIEPDHQQAAKAPAEPDHKV